MREMGGVVVVAESIAGEAVVADIVDVVVLEQGAANAEEEVTGIAVLVSD